MSENNVTRTEKLLSSVASGNPSGIDPITREEMFLSYIAGESDTKPKPITRKEKLLDKIGVSGGGGGAKPEQEKTVDITENGTTDVLPDDGYALSKVTVNANVPTTQTVPKVGFVGTKWRETGNLQQIGAVLEGDYYGTQVGDYAFKSSENYTLPFSSLEKINFKDDVTYIGEQAFYNAVALKLTELPVNLTVLKRGAFYGCNSITVSELPKGVTVVNESTFQSCASIASFTVHDAVTTVNSRAFYLCRGLKTLTFEGVLTSDMATDAISAGALETMTIGNGWAVSIYLNAASNLTQESLHGMIENLADLTGLTAKNFKVGATNLAKIDEDHIAMLNAKNWNYS